MVSGLAESQARLVAAAEAPLPDVDELNEILAAEGLSHRASAADVQLERLVSLCDTLDRIVNVDRSLFCRRLRDT